MSLTPRSPAFPDESPVLAAPTRTRTAGCWSAPLRWWPITLACLVASAAAGAAVADRYAERRWRVQGTIIHTPLPAADHARADYVPPAPKTQLALVRSPQRVETVVRELGLPVSAREIDDRLTVTTHDPADAVTVSLDWPDPAVGRSVVDRLMEAHVRDAAAFRRDRAREALARLAAERAECGRELDQARAAYRDLPPGSDGPRLTAEAGRLAAVAAALATELTAARGKLTLCREQLAGPPAGDGQPPERRQAPAEVVRAKEQEVRDLDALVAAQQKEVAVSERLLQAGAGSKQDHAKAVAELNALKARRGAAEAALRERQQEPAAPPGDRPAAGRAALERERTELEHRVAALEKGLADNQREAAVVADKAAAEQRAAGRLERADAAHKSVLARAAALDRLAGGPEVEFVVAQPAAASADPTTSDRLPLGAATGAALLAACLLGMVGVARLTRPRPPTVAGLPVLAAAEDGTPAGQRAVGRSATEARRIALTLRDPVQRSGGLILFTAADGSVPTRDVVCQLARYLSQWGESVLIVDARTEETGEPDLSDLLLPGLAPQPADPDEVELVPPRGSEPSSGLYHYLQSPTLDAAVLIQNTPLDRVRYLPAGSLFLDTDRLASAAMHRLLVQLSVKYDRVLLVGPPLDRPPGAEILAGYADGVVVSFRRGGGEGPGVSRAIGAIRRAGVPWVGAVVRSDAVAGPETRLSLRPPRSAVRRDPLPPTGGGPDGLRAAGPPPAAARPGAGANGSPKPPAGPADDEVSYGSVDHPAGGEWDFGRAGPDRSGGESDVLSAAWAEAAADRAGAGPESQTWQSDEEVHPFSLGPADDPASTSGEHGLAAPAPAWTVHFVDESGLTRAGGWDVPTSPDRLDTGEPGEPWADPPITSQPDPAPGPADDRREPG